VKNNLAVASVCPHSYAIDGDDDKSMNGLKLSGINRTAVICLHGIQILNYWIQLKTSELICHNR